jgi:signal transduction histidine kinase/CheY-like chemotaxis protein
LLLAALIPTAAFTMYQLVRLAEDEQQGIEAATLEHANEVLALANARLSADISILQAIAESPSLDTGDLSTFQELAWRVKAQNPGWVTIVLADPATDQQIIDLLRPSHSLPLPVLQSESYDRLKATMRPVIGGVIPSSPALNEPSIPVHVPVIRDGALRYVLTAAVMTDAFQDILMSKMPANGSVSAAAIVDREGKFIARSLNPEQWLARPATEYVRNAIASGRSGIYVGRTHEGAQNYTVFNTSPFSGWSAHFAIDAALIDRPRSRSLLFGALAALACVGLGGVLVAFVLRERAEARRAEATFQQMQRLEALGKMTGGIAHDFNNLLAVIVGNIEMMRRRLGDAIPPQINHIAQAAERGEKLVQQMLAFARRQPLRPQVIDVNAQIHGMADMFKRASRGDITTTFELSDGVWPVEVDPTQLESALLNLAINARDAMPKGGSVRIITRNLASLAARDGDVVEIAVSDTGAGIPPQLLGQVFDPFFTTKAPGEGTGLGLSMVHGFAGQSGGAVEIESTVGVGTTVRLRLPRAKRQPGSEGAKAEPVAARGQGSVLVVEDNAELREMTTALLGELGYAVRAAGSPAEGFDILRTFAADIIFSDILMPGGMNGFEFAREARRRYPGIDILLTSGDAGILSSADHGEFTILQKPYRIEAVSQAIRRALEHPSHRAARRLAANE